MILPSQHIRRRCLPHKMIPKQHQIIPMIDPFCERTKHESGLTYGLGPAGYDVRIAETLGIPGGGGFVLASTMEQLCMPDDVQAVVHDKSTWARQGIAVQNTIIDPGFLGFLTLEISNHSRCSVTILAGTPIAQLVFHMLLAPTDEPYDGRYQYQSAGPQPAIFEQEK